MNFGWGFFFVVWALWEYLLDFGFLGALGIVCVRRSLWVFFCGLAELFLCILPVYLGALFAFLIKFFYLSKKKKFKFQHS
jgi:hypothetical protein